MVHRHIPQSVTVSSPPAFSFNPVNSFDICGWQALVNVVQKKMPAPIDFLDTLICVGSCRRVSTFVAILFSSKGVG